MTGHQIFISNSYYDSDWAMKFAEELNKLGLNVWFDQFKVGLGRVWAEAIEKGLRESEIVVFLIRPEDLEVTGLSNANLFLELGAAVSMGKTIIPVVPEGLDSSKLPSPLRLVRGVRRTTPEATAIEFAKAFTAIPQKAA